MRYPDDMSAVRHLTIRTFGAGDPRGYFLVGAGEIVRMGESLSFFRSRVGGDEGFVTWRYGDMYWVSLRPWEGMDPELTYVDPVFHRPYDRAALEQRIVKPRRAHPRSRSHTPYARVGWVSVFKVDCSAYGFDHEISLYPPTPATETSAEELLTYPAVHERTFLCPVCDTIIPLEEPLAPRIREMAIELGNPEARMQLVITHPTDLPETKRGDGTYPFVVDRYERFSLSSQQRLNAEQSIFRFQASVFLGVPLWTASTEKIFARGFVSRWSSKRISAPAGGRSAWSKTS